MVFEQMASKNLNSVGRLNRVLDVLSKQKETLSLSNADALHAIMDERLRARFSDFEAKLASTDKRISQVLDKLDDVLGRVKRVEDKCLQFTSFMNKTKSDSDGSVASPRSDSSEGK